MQRKKSVHICTSRRGGKYKYVSKMNVTSRTFVNTRLVFIRESSGGKFRLCKQLLIGVRTEELNLARDSRLQQIFATTEKHASSRV